MEYSKELTAEIASNYRRKTKKRMKTLAAGIVAAGLTNYHLCCIDLVEAEALREALAEMEDGNTEMLCSDDPCERSLIAQADRIFPRNDLGPDNDNTGLSPCRFVIGSEGSRVVYVCAESHFIPWKTSEDFEANAVPALAALAAQFGCDAHGVVENPSEQVGLRWPHFAYRFWWD